MAAALWLTALSMIGNFGRKSSRNFVPALAIALLLALGGCGGDDEESSPAPVATAPTETATTETEAESQTETAPAETEQEAPEAESETSPEDEPGGAGDEEPARTLALFTADNGRIAPRVVRVPAFIAIQIELRSKDGSEYGLRFGDATITAGGGLSSVSTTIDGLRPGAAVIGKPTGAHNRVRIEATAEPGP